MTDRHIIYRLTNKINGKVYIGQTSRPLEERMAEHLRHDQIIIDRAIKKYGIENFELEVVDTAADIDELNRKEQEWIEKSDCMVPNGYNQTVGGDVSLGYHHKKETRRKMSEAKDGMYFGADNPFYGKTHSTESREKMSHTRKGRKLSKEWREKIGKSQWKKVMNIETGEVFDSIKQAAEAYGLFDTNITQACKGKQKTSGGYHWQYFDAGVD